MTSLQTHPSFAPTSAAGPMLMGLISAHERVGHILAGRGTSTNPELPQDWGQPSRRLAEQTSAGAPVLGTQRIGAAIGELRRLSGLTWEQLARVFGVSRRSLHFWASGKPMAPGNEEHLQRVLSVVRKIDLGSAAENRIALLGARDDGVIPFDLLVARDYARVLMLLGTGDARRAAPPRPSEEARSARAPRPPGELVGALQDRIHPTSGRLLAAKPISTHRRK